MTQPVLSVQNLSVAFDAQGGAVRVVEDVSFDLNRGQAMGLVGESGSGKTMIGLSAMRLVPHPGRIATGTIKLDGIDIMSQGEAQMRAVRGSQIAMVLQDPMTSLNPTLTIGTQMIEAVRAHSQVSAPQARERARDALGKVGINNPEERLDAYPHQFSGGMRQRVAIATAMINRPKVLIADEPTTALDVTIQAQILAEVRKLCQQEGTALLWISHDLAVVSGLVDKVGVMYAGQLAECGPIHDVIHQPRHPYTSGLIASIPDRTPSGHRLPQISGMVPPPSAWPQGCRFAPRCFQARAACSEPPPLALLDGSRLVRCFFPLAPSGDRAARAPLAQPQAEPSVQPVLIEVEQVTKTFRRSASLLSKLAHMALAKRPDAMPALDRVNLKVHKGEVLGIVGESGSGKSTLARILVGMMEPDSGTVHRHLRRASGRLGAQMIFQDAMASLNPRQWVGQAISEAPLLHGIWGQEEAAARLEALLLQVGIDPGYATRYPHQFSGGQRQRIAIARALAVEPEVLICDEAVASLDVSIQAQIINLLADLRKSLDLTYVFIGHDLGVVRHVSDRVLVMYLGRIVEEGRVGDVFNSPAHPYTQALVAGAPRVDKVAPPDEMKVPWVDLSRVPVSGCGYAPRCQHATAQCSAQVPELQSIGAERRVACFVAGACA